MNNALTHEHEQIDDELLNLKNDIDAIQKRHWRHFKPALMRLGLPGNVLWLVDSIDALGDSRMEIDDSSRDGVIRDFVAFVDQHE